jgi:catechol 2,3-dioxygenase-like lactoylglutathione lyase family enzyme
VNLKLTGVVLDAPDAGTLADFYERLLGWERRRDEPGWVVLRPADDSAQLAFASEPLFARPTWPSTATDQQMMLHLDIEVDNLDAGVAHAVAAGATVAEYQPQRLVRVMLDPVGHPFCLWTRE